MTLRQNTSEIKVAPNFSSVLPNHIKIIEGGGIRTHLTFSGTSFISTENNNTNFVERALSHPKCPILNEAGKGEFLKAYKLLDKLPFKLRRSGEPYSTHLERAVFYYLEFCRRPTLEGMIRALHHDSFEDFPSKRSRLQKAIGITNLRATVGLAKMSPEGLGLAQKAGIFSKVVDVHKRVRASLATKMPMLQSLEFDKSTLRIVNHNSQYIFPFLNASGILKPTSRDPEFLIMLGTLIQEIMLSGDEEDLIEELCLIIYLSEEASHDDLYIKIAGDRVDNLLDIEFLEKAIAQFDGDSKDKDKIEKYFKSSYKALATSQAYLFLTKSILKDPELYGVIASLMRWSQEKLSNLREQFGKKLQ